MSEIYLAHPDSGEPIATEETVLRTLWEQGFLSEELLYWRSGLADWIRLGDWYERQTGLAARSLNGKTPKTEPDTADTHRRERCGGRAARFHPRHPRRRSFHEAAFEIDFDF